MKIKLSLIAFLFAFSPANAQVNINTVRTDIHVDFSKPTDHPLSKNKVGGIYQTPWVSAGWLERDIPKISELESRSMRYEIAWGQRGFGSEMITKKADGSLEFDFAPLDLFTGLVSRHGANLVMSHSYNPAVAGGRAVEPPADHAIYKEVNRTFARHWSDLKLQNHYIEIWNEPDNKPNFFAPDATIEDYFKIYGTAVEGIIEGDPDAKVGGPAAAFTGWHAPLLAECARNGWPLHFLSGHNYGDPVPQLTAMRNALVEAGRPDVEMLMTEYSPYIPWIGETWGGGLVERFEAGMTFFNAAETFLTYPDLTYVHWAQYIDGSGRGAPIPANKKGDKMGLVDGNGGNRKALFNAFKIYGAMPVDRFELSSSSSAVRGFASADPNNAGVVLWNTTKLHQDVNVTVDNLPFGSGEAKLYRIDPWNSWYETGNDSLKVLQTFSVGSGKFTWSGGIPELSVVFISFDDLTGRTELAPNPFAYVIRTHHWFEDRNAPAWSDFDFKTWITRLGMGNADAGNAVTGVYAGNLPAEFNVRYVFSGNMPRKEGPGSTVNFRIDFQNRDGEYVRSVLFHGGLYEPQENGAINWGTKRNADRTVEVNLSDFDVKPSKYAPAGWNGKATVTYQMRDTGAGSRAKVFVKRIR